MGTAPPPALEQFLVEREFWKELGLTREALQGRPHREIADYSLIIQVIRRDEQARANRRQ